MRPLLLLLAGLALPYYAQTEGQTESPITWIELPDQPGHYLMVQTTQDDTLILTPNESFFPKLGLKAEGPAKDPDIDELNKGSSFSKITGWDPGEQAEWGIYFPKTGELKIDVQSEGGDFELSLNGEKSLFVSSPGFHTLQLTCTRSSASSRVSNIRITGPPATGASVVRKRWRPAAAHTKFESSKSPDKVRLWIMEMDAAPGDLNSYSPITTPFGYYGPTWNADGTVNTSFNFSLWSFGRNEEEPPIEHLSHLIAIGNPDATFGGFDHEGTGVKIRDWEPLEGRQGQSQALALRVEPGAKYDTYYSYFFASDENRWHLFGAGKKYNKGKPLNSLWVGSFVEVPGPAPVQRTGPYTRSMRYRGWVMDESGKWYPLDRMQNGNIDKETGYTHTDRGITEDGWFYLATGGWTFQDPPNKGEDIELPYLGKPDVEYLDTDDLEFLTQVPSEISISKVERSGEKARITYTVRNAGENAEAFLYWGDEEGLTFKDRWENEIRLISLQEGKNEQIIEGIKFDSTLYVRPFLRNSDGQFWSFETASSAP